MLSYALRRCLYAVPIVIAISFVIFWIMWLSPTNFSIDDSLGQADTAPDTSYAAAKFPYLPSAPSHPVGGA